LLLCAFGAGADAASRPAQTSLVVAAADFGSPPSGEIPILYNDHHVYANPDRLKQNRVLAAIVKNGVILVPLRSMFEMMGGQVTYDDKSKTVTAQKPGASVQVTLGKSEAVINGETRPLDVPPEMYKGVLVVPVRVMSEALGAYVQWVPDRRIAVVRYIPPTPVPTPPPTAPPTAPPTPAPTPTPTPAPTAPSYTVFVQGAYAWSRVSNEFSSGHNCCASYVLAGAIAPEHSAFALKVDYRNDAYVTSDNFTDLLGNHYTSFATVDGGTELTPVFLARQSTLDGRLEFKIASPRIYVGIGYIQTTTNYGYPHLNGLGGGLEKLPDLRSGIGWFGSAFYYPSASGNYTIADPASPNFGTSYQQQYQIYKYDLGLTLASARFPVYLYGGFSGDRYIAKQNAPIAQTHSGPYVGLGVKF
jgi:hypothetical protein